MFKVLFETEAEKTMESINEAFMRATGDTAIGWGYETMEDVEQGIREGWLEFKDGKLIVWAEEGR